jgi:hypothetical protein
MVAEEDDSVVDVYFPDDPNYVFGDLGTALCGEYLEFEGTEDLMSDEEIEACIAKMEAEGGGLDELVTDILNQKNEGSCVGNAVTQALMVILHKQYGKTRGIRLSAISIYKQIGRSAGSGAMVSDAMTAVEKTGILPLDTPENREKFGDHVMPATGFSTRFPDGWKETAAKFRGFEFLVIRSVAALLTALCKGYPVVAGREGHSICYLRPMRRNGRRVVKFANSWNETWGDEGFGYDTENQFRKSASWAFAIRAAVSPE